MSAAAEKVKTVSDGELHILWLAAINSVNPKPGAQQDAVDAVLAEWTRRERLKLLPK
jgi:hypothetical protein